MKRLIVCLDGTWNRADDPKHSTNVVAMMRAIAPGDQDGVEQVLFYDKGVGTGGFADRLRGGMSGKGLDTNVRDAYIFLGNNYVPGDEIYVFGFSRGAFTARSLVGMLHVSGLLNRWTLGRLPEAWAHYRRNPAQDDDRSERIGAEVRVKCLGVWDTVGSLGLPLRWVRLAHWYNRRFAYHHTDLGPHVENAFHALAIDEARGQFAPILWTRRANAGQPDGQVVEQVWFTGAHSDVGGGYGRSDATDGEGSLSPVSLRWMIERVQATTGLVFHDDWSQITARADPLAPMHESRSWLYATSWFLPHQRVIGGQDGWTRRWAPSRTVTPEGHESINEAIHRSVLDRCGQQVETIRKSRRRKAMYRPPSVQAAEPYVPVAEAGAVTPSKQTPVTPRAR